MEITYLLATHVQPSLKQQVSRIKIKKTTVQEGIGKKGVLIKELKHVIETLKK